MHALIHRFLHLRQTIIILSFSYLYLFLRFPLQLSDVDGLLHISMLRGWRADVIVLGFWGESVRGKRWNVLLAFFLAGLAEFFEGDAGIFLKKSGSVAALETILAVPLETGAGEAD